MPMGNLTDKPGQNLIIPGQANRKLSLTKMNSCKNVAFAFGKTKSTMLLKTESSV